MLFIPFFIFISKIVFVSPQEVIYYPSKAVSLRQDESNLPKSSNLTQSLITKTFVENISSSDRLLNVSHKIKKRSPDSTFHGHPKTKEDMWAKAFHGTNVAFNQVPSLVSLIHMLAVKHLNDCTPVILYDKVAESKDALLLQQLMQNFPLAYVHGRIGNNNTITEPNILKTMAQYCVNYILFMGDVMNSAEVLGLQATSRIVVVTRSSQWRVQEFLLNKVSRKFVNLLVVAQSFRDDDTMETPYILYTHSLFVDGLGASKPEVLTSWSKGKLARPEIDLFPPKMTQGYAGHRFVVLAADQPPFVFKRIYTDNLGNRKVSWDGIEYRMLNLLGHRNNFTIDVKEPDNLSSGSGDSVGISVIKGHGDLGIGGLYITTERLDTMDMSISHSQDCAVFISLTSTALPRYRAIMGPFHWTVWVALTITYLFGIFPLAFSDKHTLRHLLHNSGEIENMFWYVFGTFTNCFTFVGKNSWSKTTKVTTRLLIGWYWIFTIIITACYTGSIIAFVTLPVYPSTVDTVRELVSGNYRVGTLETGGWPLWFANSSDKYTNKLLKHLELVPNIEAGLMNTTKAFFWSYAFLGSKYQLEYVVQSNFSLESSKRSVLHISDECFAPFGVSLAFPKESVYTEKFNRGILRMIQTGIKYKMESDVKWDMQRTASGKLLQVSYGNSLRAATADERGLSLSDTQGMFLLLGAGCLAAAAALLSEWLGGCGRMCRRKRPSSTGTMFSTSSVDTDKKSEVTNDDSNSIKDAKCHNKNHKTAEVTNVDDADDDTDDEVIVYDLQKEKSKGCCGGIFDRFLPPSSGLTVSSAGTKYPIVPTPNSKTEDWGVFIYSSSNNGSPEIISERRISTIGDEYKDRQDCTFDVDNAETEVEDINEKQIQAPCQINIIEYIDTNFVQDEDSISSDNIVHGARFNVIADIGNVYVGNELTNGHSRKSSYIDWDGEVNRLCHYTKTEGGSDEGPARLLNALEHLQEGFLLEDSETIFGERVSPVDLDDSLILIDEEAGSGDLK